MDSSSRVALVGDFNPDVTAHIAIPKALEISSVDTGHPIEAVWMPTNELSTSVNALQSFDAVWCVPASPYVSMEGALSAIRHARENGLPFLGTCGGYQHAALEFARHVLGLTKVDNGEIDPDAEMPLIAPLSCALVEQSGDIEFEEGSMLARIHGTTRVTETYHCSYGIAPNFVNLFDDSALRVTGVDVDGEPRAFELVSHPFFIGTAYQPERSALSGQPHPLINAFVAATAGAFSLVAEEKNVTRSSNVRAAL